MRKLFRMMYESCTGQCYHPDDVMSIHTLGLDAHSAATFLRRLLAMHAPSCGNDQLAFRLDHDDEIGIFVASFQRYGALDLFADRTPLGAMNKMIDATLRFYESDEFKVKGEHADRESICHHGTDEKLVDFALRFSGLGASEQFALRAQFMGVSP